MTETDTLEQRLRTVERAVTDGTTEFPEITELAEIERRVAAVEERVADIDERTSDLEAATQALRGYVGNVRSVNEDVEQRANAALAATDRLEAQIDSEPASRRTPGTAKPRSQRPQRDATTDSQGATGDARTETPGTAHASDAPDFSAITDGGDPDGGEDPETSVFGRLRELL